MPIRYVARKFKNFIIYRVLGLADTPHRIALGVAIGFFVAWLPLIGLQMILIFALSIILRANKAVGLPFAWVSNPATLWMYIPNYFLGTKLLGANYNVHTLMNALTHAFGLSNIGLWQRVVELKNALLAMFWPLMLGSVIIGLFVGVIVYIATYYSVLTYRRHRHRFDLALPTPPLEHDRPTDNSGE